MKAAPQLQDGEEIVHHHVPDLRAFKRTALLLLAITLVPTAVFLFAFPDSMWVAVPLFVSCLLLMQERFTLGKYSAWVTNQRILLQGDVAIGLGDIVLVDVIGNAVRLRHGGASAKTKLYYPEDRDALAKIILDARQEAQ